MRPGDPAMVVANTYSPGNFVAYAVAKDNQPLVDALNSGLDAVIADGTWANLYSQWVPRTLPPGWKPGSQGSRCPDIAGLRRDRRESPPRRRWARPRRSRLLAHLRDSFFDWDMYRQAIPTLLITGLPNTLILTNSATVIGLVLGMVLADRGNLPQALAALAGAGIHRHLPRSSRSGDHPAHRDGHRTAGGRADQQQSLPAGHRGIGVDGRRLHQARFCARESKAWTPVSWRPPARWGSAMRPRCDWW